jgi:hypothetical protein
VRTYVLRRLLLFVPTLDIAEISVYATGSEASGVQPKSPRAVPVGWVEGL